jgi:hypothetical protein
MSLGPEPERFVRLVVIRCTDSTGDLCYVILPSYAAHEDEAHELSRIYQRTFTARCTIPVNRGHFQGSAYALKRAM